MIAIATSTILLHLHILSTPNINTDQTSILASQTPTPNLNNEEDNLQLKINNQDETSMLEQTGGTRVAQPIYNLDPNQMKKIEQAVHVSNVEMSGSGRMQVCHAFLA